MTTLTKQRKNLPLNGFHVTKETFFQPSQEKEKKLRKSKKLLLESQKEALILAICNRIKEQVLNACMHADLDTSEKTEIREELQLVLPLLSQKKSHAGMLLAYGTFCESMENLIDGSPLLFMEQDVYLELKRTLDGVGHVIAQKNITERQRIAFRMSLLYPAWRQV